MLSGDCWRCISVLFVLAVFSAIVSYARGYIDAQNGKKLERDAEEIKNAKKLLTFTEKKDQKIEDALWAFQMLLFTFEGILCGVITLMLFENVKVSFSKSLFDLLMILCFGLVYAFIYIVILRRFFSAVGTARGRKTEKYRTYGLIRFLYALSCPLSAFYNLFTKLFLRMFGIGSHALDEEITQDEILEMVDQGEETGAIESGEKEMIENVLDFTDATAGELLTHRTVLSAIDVEASEEEIVHLIDETGYSRFPVYEGDVDNILGILSSRRYLLNLVAKKEEKQNIRDLLFSPHFVPESVHADVLLSDMKKNQIHMAVVVDEYGGTAGVITMEDLLEEIVGNIYDETDDKEDEVEIEKLEENLFKVKGSLPLEQLSDALGVSIPENLDFDTLSGLVFSRLPEFPEDGSTPSVDCFNLHIDVEEIKDHRVESALVSKTEKEDEDDEKEKE